MVDGILNNEMTLVYEQLIYTNNGEQILEIVWELPSGSYQEFDTDRWVVFHFHFEHLANRDGVNRPGIYAVNASVDPEILKKKENAEKLQAMHARIAKQYRTLDTHSTRFVFPQDEFKLVVFRPSFVEIAPPPVQQKADAAKFFRKDGNLYYPDKLVLVENMIKTLLKEELPGSISQYSEHFIPYRQLALNMVLSFQNSRPPK